MEVILIPLPRGRHALVQFDPRTGRVTTNHAGLYATAFQQGVTDFDGTHRRPSDGRAFLSALYDHLFLHGYRVQWLKGGAASSRRAKRPE